MKTDYVIKKVVSNSPNSGPEGAFIRVISVVGMREKLVGFIKDMSGSVQHADRLPPPGGVLSFAKAPFHGGWIASLGLMWRKTGQIDQNATDPPPATSDVHSNMSRGFVHSGIGDLPFASYRQPYLVPVAMPTDKQRTERHV